jgi:serine/threonine protein kinase
MDRANFQRVKELFRSAVALEPTARRAFLEQACPGDDTLRFEVEELLRHSDASQADFLLHAPAASPHRAAAPLNIPGFLLHERIAVGASSVVYRARQLQPRREVAVKVLRVDALGPAALERFGREAQILATLQHPGIAHVYGAGVADGAGEATPWIAMELVHGATLERYCASAQPSLSALLRLFVELCRALEHAHARGIVHRDLKPSNVMVDETGRVRVLDFGVARLTDPEREPRERATRAGALLGTLSYMAPEQARGEHADVTPAADVYALGALLFELIRGRLPLEVGNLELLDALRAVVEVEPARLRDGRPDISSELDAVVGKCLEKDPGLRYAHAGALADDLQRYLDNRPVLARRPSLVTQAHKLILRHSTLASVAAAIVLALAGGLLLSLHFLREQRRQQERTSEALAFFANEVIDLAPRLGLGGDQRVRLEDVELRLRGELEFDSDNRALRATLARTLYELACIDQDAREFASQRSHAANARALCEGLLADRPDDVDASTQLSRVCAKLGEAARDMGSQLERDEWFARALEIDRRLVAEGGRDPELVEDLGWSLERVADAALLRGDLPLAQQLAAERMRDARELLESNPRNWKFAFNLSHAHFFQAHLDSGSAAVDARLTHVRRGVRLAEVASELDPQRRDLVAWLTVARCRAAARYRECGRFLDAWPYIDGALGLAEHLAVAEPARAEHVRILDETTREFVRCVDELDEPERRGRASEALRHVVRLLKSIGSQRDAEALLALADKIDAER